MEEEMTREQLEKKLTEKERVFCWRYVVLRNGAKAAREAGYSEKTCYVIASENLTKPHIQQYIEIIKDQYEEATGVTKFRQLEELAKIAYSSISHLHETWIELSEFEKLTDEQKAAIESIETKTVTTNFDETTKTTEYVKVKLYSKIAAISEINKMMGYNAPEKFQTTLIKPLEYKIID